MIVILHEPFCLKAIFIPYTQNTLYLNDMNIISHLFLMKDLEFVSSLSLLQILLQETVLYLRLLIVLQMYF